MDNNRTQIIESSVNWFIENRSRYKKLCNKIESIISEVLEVQNIPFHIITSRVKDVESFRNKISDEKYDNPIEQITDFSGIRIITYVEDDVKKISEVIESIFKIDKAKSIDKSTSLGTDKVGYKSVHYIAELKNDRLELVEYKSLEGLVFEIQIRTILQHAWAEIEHDKNYKFSGSLPTELARRFMLLAGSLEIADREFNNISREIDTISSKVEKGTKSGKLNFEINSTSLRQFIKTKFSRYLHDGGNLSSFNSEKAINELNNFGISNLEEFNILLDKNLIDDIIDYYLKRDVKQTRIVGLIRLILILVDYKKYFEKSYDNKWVTWNSKYKNKDIFDKYKVDWNIIEENYGVRLY